MFFSLFFNTVKMDLHDGPRPVSPEPRPVSPEPVLFEPHPMNYPYNVIHHMCYPPVLDNVAATIGPRYADAYPFYRHKECTRDLHVPAHRMFNFQCEITPEHRSIVVDWMVDIHHGCLQSTPEALYSAVHILDSYVAKKKNISKHHLQRLGGVSLWIASKYWDASHIQKGNMSAISHQIFSHASAIVATEADILLAIGFRIRMPSAYLFLNLFLMVRPPVPTNVRLLSTYILEETLQSHILLNWLPSQLAAGAIFLAVHSLSGDPFVPATFSRFPGYCSSQDVLYVAQAIFQQHSLPSDLVAVKEKYQTDMFCNIAHIVVRGDFF